MRLQGKIAIISGGNRGLGLLLAKAFLREGAKVAICARSLESLRKLDDILAEYEGSYFYAACDITIPLQVSNLVKKVVLEFGSVNILINNAAKFGEVCKVHQCSVDNFNSVIKTNLIGSHNMVREVVPHFLEQNHGKIIHITDSSVADGDTEHRTAYHISKSGIETLSNLISVQYKENHIDCNLVDPSSLVVCDELSGEIGHAKQVSFDDQEVDVKSCLQSATELFIWLASIESNGVSGKRIKASEWLAKQDK
ncbi:MAG: SDR family oxidoreductase [Candidatus Cloacimonetes bacterium]|nr:SDR family oxidoreductase [Candidatus Cloacimonadota bacterium]